MLDTLRGQALIPAKSVDILPTALIFRIVGDDFNVAIVDVATAERGSDIRSSLDLAEFVGWSAGTRDLGQEIVNMSRASPGTEHRRVSKWRIEAVEVPPKRADAARNDSSIIGSRLLAHVADNRTTLVISQGEEVWKLLVVLPLSAKCVS
jgi:hypothetical protein